MELTAKEWLRIAKEAKAAGTTWVCVTGGEPLLHPEFPLIWERLTEMGFFLTLQTNASLIRGKMLDLLDRCPPRQVKVTLYGSDDEVYQAVCGVEQGFTRVNEGIHNLMSLGIPVELVSTIIRQNQNDTRSRVGPSTPTATGFPGSPPSGSSPPSGELLPTPFPWRSRKGWRSSPGRTRKPAFGRAGS